MSIWWVVRSATGDPVDVAGTFFSATLRAEALARETRAGHHVAQAYEAPIARTR